MKIQGAKLILFGLLLSGLTATVFMQPASVAIAQQSAPNSSNNTVLFYRGVWTGTYANVGSQGKVQMYIDPSEELHGSLASNDGQDFAQISGYHRGNEFHIVFTPPVGVRNQFGGRSPVTVDATATWKQSQNGTACLRLNAKTRTGHTQEYDLERVQVIQ
jgi:hypothetical protein